MCPRCLGCPQPPTFDPNFDLLYVSSKTSDGKGAICASGATGKVQWQAPTDAGVCASPLVVAGSLDLVVAGDTRDKVYAVSSTGRHIWTTQLGQGAYTSSAAMIISDPGFPPPWGYRGLAPSGGLA